MACEPTPCTCDPNPLPPTSQYCISSKICAKEPFRKKPHEGVDYKVPCGKDIIAPFDGIAKLEYQPGGAGLYIRLRDKCNNEWLFFHMQEAPGDKGLGGGREVKKGDYLGKTGNSGHSTGCHIHVEIRCKGNKLDDVNRYFNWSNCPPLPDRGSKRAEDKTELEALRSGDPNEKIGPRGISPSNYLSIRENLSYIIFFENVDSASAAAQEIAIVDTISIAKTNHSSFSLGPIVFGSHVITLPPRIKQFVTSVDLRPADTLLVNINAHFDTLTGIASWRFQAIDPMTGEPPEDPQKGVLPPNVFSPEGEGSVSFVIDPIDTLAFGTEIRNRASIVFDTNPAIQTGEWFNAIDNLKPHSRVLAIAPIQDSTRFPIRWAGTDTGSGIMDYSIYVSVDSGVFVPWLHNTTSTTEFFTGLPNTRYGFYCIARDSVGNVEAPKDNADAVVTVVTGVKDRQHETPKQYSLSQSYPNPFNPTTIIQYALPVAGKVTLKIYDILGREVKTLVDEVQQTGYKTVEWDSKNNAGIRVATGTYFYRLEATRLGGQEKSFVQVRKMLLRNTAVRFRQKTPLDRA